MATLQEGSPSTPTGCCCTTPQTMAAPIKGGSKKKYKFMTKWVLDSVDELLPIFMEEKRKRENSEEAIEAMRKKKVRTLMSMR